MLRAFVGIVSALLLTGLAVAPLQAKSVNLPSGNPILSADIPSDWKVTPSKRGISIKSPDEEVFAWIEVYLPADVEEVRGEHERYFVKQNVKIVGEPKVNTNEADAGSTVRVVATDFPATWKNKPTVLRYLSIDPNLPTKNQVLISYWASPEGDKEFRSAFGSIIKSLDAPK